MKVILFETIESLGRPGDIVDVKAGYFRNYLFPRGLCQLATPGNLKKLSAKRKHLETQAASQMDEAKTRAESLEGTEIEFAMRSAVVYLQCVNRAGIGIRAVRGDRDGLVRTANIMGWTRRQNGKRLCPAGRRNRQWDGQHAHQRAEGLARENLGRVAVFHWNRSFQ